MSIVAGMARGKKAAPAPVEDAAPPTIEGIFRSYTVVLDDDKDKVSKDDRSLNYTQIWQIVNEDRLHKRSNLDFIE